MSNDMKGYEISMFMIFLTFAIKIINYIVSVYSPGTSLFVPDDGNILQSILSVVVLEPDFSLATLSLFAFSLLIMNFVFIKALFLYSTITIVSVLSFIPIPDVFKVPIYIGVVLAAYSGIVQVSSRQTFQGS